jgi:transposase
LFDIPKVKYVYIYPKTINMNWGERKLSQLCRDEMGIDLKEGNVFLFFNNKKDQMKLFFKDVDGSQEFTKRLPQGGFLVPVPKEGERFVRIGRDKLNSLFKTSLLT